MLPPLRPWVFLVALSAVGCGGGPPPSDGEGEGESEAEEDGALTVSPLSCALGEVLLGSAGFCTVTLLNEGAADLHLAPASVTDESAPDVFSVSEIEGAMAPGAATTLRIAAEPTAAGLASATVELRGSASNEALASISVSAVGVPLPTCVARVKSVNGVQVEAETPHIAPLDNVVLTLDSSSVAPGRTISSYQWSLWGYPIGSTVALTTPSSVETGFTFDDALGLDTAGTFNVRASVVDSAGLLDECEITLDAVPTSPLFAQLTWSSPETDVDLHMTRASDALCSSLDCYALTCEPGGVSWGNDSQSPRMIVSDDSGFGPESVTLEAPLDGVYRLSVHARSVLVGPTPVVLRLFSGGSLVSEQAASVAADGLWRALDVTCVSGSCTAQEDGSLETLVTCAP